MPDPADPDFLAELENFSTPGLTMDPLPAAEVRRRGTRMRRRHQALATVGAVAAVAMIATPIALAASGGNQGQPLPVDQQPPGGWTTTIPTDFPLKTGFPTPATTRPAAVGEIPNCGDWPSQKPADDLAVRYRGESEDYAQRWLVVYPDEATAAAELDALRNATADCAPVPGGQGIEMFFSSVPAPDQLTADDAYAYTQQARHDDGLISDLTLVEVFRTGNALLYDSAYGSAGGDQAVQYELDRRTGAVEPTVAAMCVFSIEGCDPAAPDASEAVDEPTGLSGTIPDAFPLDEGLPTDAEGGIGLEGPAHELDLEGYNVESSLRACGAAPTGLPEPVDTLYAGHRSISTGILRQLMTFASADAAQAYAEGVIAPFAACPEDADDRGVGKTYEVDESDLGDYAASSVMRVEVDGEPGPGGQIVQVVRVGQAVLQTLVNHDGDAFDADAVTAHLDGARAVVDEMD